MKDEFNRAGPVLHLPLRYTQALITQMVQTVQGTEMVMRQELVANMLGVPREGGDRRGTQITARRGKRNGQELDMGWRSDDSIREIQARIVRFRPVNGLLA
jgi:hypothetical protein